MDKIDKRNIVDINGKPLVYGNYDPNILSVDDNPSYAMRKPSDYADVPAEVKKAEISFILPMANFLAKTLGINIIEEKMYEKTLEQLKQRSLFVVLNLEKVQIQQGVAAWYGLILMCKKHPLIMVKFKLQISTGRIGISQCRLWEKDKQRYIVLGDPEQKTLLNREDTASKILNYLRNEGIVRV